VNGPVSCVAAAAGLVQILLSFGSNAWRETGFQSCDAETCVPARRLSKNIRVDQGFEFISRDLDLWAYQRGVEPDFSRPGKPTGNAFIVSFNGKFRSECLNAH